MMEYVWGSSEELLWPITPFNRTEPHEQASPQGAVYQFDAPNLRNLRNLRMNLRINLRPFAAPGFST